MAKSNTKPAAEEKPEAAEAKFSIEKLRENCLTLFGVASSTFDGATYGLNGDFTVDELKNIIAKWQNKEVK